MAIFGEAKKVIPPQTDLIPIGAQVDVTSGSYPGHTAVIVGHTRKKYHVRLDTGHVTALKQSSVRLSTRQIDFSKTNEPKPPTYRTMIARELEKIRASVEEIYILMDRMRLEDEPHVLPSG